MKAASNFDHARSSAGEWNATLDATHTQDSLLSEFDLSSIFARHIEPKRSDFDEIQQVGDRQYLFRAEESSPDINNIINIPALFAYKAMEDGWSVRTLQEWEGIIESVADDAFAARIRDLTDQRCYVEYAEIPLDEVDPSDLFQVKVGAVFNLIIGYFNRGNGQRRETMLYFRKDFSAINNENDATELAALLGSLPEF